MRIGLIAALRRSDDGTLRAAMPLAGRSVLGWQAALLTDLGVERVLCLTESLAATDDILGLQHALEAGGVQFHALKGFAALPALVRAEDDLIVLLDGLVPDPQVVRAVLGGGSEDRVSRAVATIPADHPLAVSRPADFERIDANRHWAGVLAMRGAPVQHLSDFPEDADAISLLLRLALQAGTPARELAARELVPESWLLAESAAAVERHEADLVARAAPVADWRAPSASLAGMLVRSLVPRGLAQGGVVAGSLALAALLGALMLAAFGFPAAGLALAAAGVFGGEVARTFGTLAARLRREDRMPRGGAVLGAAADALVALALWFALAPWPEWQPLAVLGPVAVGLARAVSRPPGANLTTIAGDRPAMLLVLALAAGFGLLPEALACLALGLVAALLLRR